MRGLTPEQRRKHLEKVKADEAKRKEASKPKPGQKGAPTSGGAKTKGGTIGGGNTNTPRPTSKTKPKPTPSNKPKPVGDGRGGLSKPSGTTGRTTPQSRATAPRPSASSRPQSPFAEARAANLEYINSDPRFAAPAPQPPRSPAIGAPVHASPSAFGSAARLAPPPQPSPYVGSSAATPPRPSTPGQAVMATEPPKELQWYREPTQQQPMSAQYGGNDEPGRLGQSEGGYAGQRQPSPVGPVSDGGDYAHMVLATRPQQAPVDENGIDMERRRAFLDAEDSLSGLKAVKELLNRRKLSIAVES